MDLFCGVDGGGTRTRAVVADGEGLLVGFGASTASNPKAVGLEAAARAVGEALIVACKEAPREATLRCFLGLAGVRTEHDAAAVSDAMRPMLGGLGFAGVDFALGGDIRNALAGAHGGKPGVVVIVGTGSSAFGCDAAGNYLQAGGWGWFIDDPGSGNWLGYQAMRAAARSHDGRGPATALEEAVRAFLRIKTLHEMPNIIYNPHFSRERVAELAPIVFSVRDSGDAVAASIVDEGFAELALMAATVARRLDMPRAHVAAVGGVAESVAGYGDDLRAALHRISPDLRVTRPRVIPVVGATVLAMKAGNVAIADPQLKALDDAVAGAMARPPRLDLA